ncbi:unnamed protein product [Cylicocyclus nassatus]|uniref:Uncharacterized protein n=1 Tax=Cylicocyclus nassatus TaxID=53992 RepID=A0AA36GL81_CYLNA|nr:unnamed protein product [Cylicocyclus nassatus]
MEILKVGFENEDRNRFLVLGGEGSSGEKILVLDRQVQLQVFVKIKELVSEALHVLRGNIGPKRPMEKREAVWNATAGDPNVSESLDSRVLGFKARTWAFYDVSLHSARVTDALTLQTFGSSNHAIRIIKYSV